jgi:hypothetical protein
MLGEMIALEAGPIVALDELEALLVEICERQLVAVEVIKNAELHGSPSGPIIETAGHKMIDF